MNKEEIQRRLRSAHDVVVQMNTDARKSTANKEVLLQLHWLAEVVQATGEAIVMAIEEAAP